VLDIKQLRQAMAKVTKTKGVLDVRRVDETDRTDPPAAP